MKATFENDEHYKFVFFTNRRLCEELVRCFYPDGERETVTLDYFLRVMRAEKRKRRMAHAELLSYRRRNQ